MSQFDFGNLSSPLTGTAFINSNLEPWRDALHSSHGGNSEPSYVVSGMVWLDTNTTPWVYKMYDGTQNVSLGTINASTHAYKPDITGLANDVSNAMLANMNANTVKVRSDGSAGAPQDLSMGASTILARLAAGNIVAASVAQIKTLLAIASSDVSGLGTAATQNTGTSGANLPFLNGINTWSKAQIGAAVSLTSTSNSIALDLSLSNNFKHTFTENTTLANPTNAVEGQSGCIYFTQHASAPKTLAYGSNYKWAGASAGTISNTNSAKDTIYYNVRSSTEIELSMTNGNA